MCWFCSDICKWLDILVFSDKDENWWSEIVKEGAKEHTLLSKSRKPSSQSCDLALYSRRKKTSKLGHLSKFLSSIVDCSMQSGQSPLQSIVKSVIEHIHLYSEIFILWKMRERNASLFYSFHVCLSAWLSGAKSKWRSAADWRVKHVKKIL